MKILFTSDIHGSIDVYEKYAALLPEFDLGIIGGDLLCLRTDEKRENQIRSLLDSCAVKVLFIMGNMDSHEWHSVGNLVNINQKKVAQGGLDFIGYMYTDPFMGGIFEKSTAGQQHDLDKLESLLNKNTVGKSTILVTHGPPYGTLDKIHSGKSVGSRPLAGFVNRTNPKWHLFGHIHEAAGINGKSVNGAWPGLKKFVCIDTDLDKAEYV